MTKSELIEFLEPFTDDVEMDILTPIGTVIPLAMAQYRIPDGEGRILLIPSMFTNTAVTHEVEAA